MVGSSQTLTWTPGNGGDMTIELSRDGGTNWRTINASTSNDGSETWTVTGPDTAHALLRISNLAGADVSNAEFTVEGSLFSASFDYGTGGRTISAAAGDFNEDGKQDVAAFDDDASNALAILLGNGNGTLQDRVAYPLGSYPSAVAVGDFDGHDDLAVTQGGYSRVGVILGKGDGTFQAEIDYPTDLDPHGLAVGDVNGDGKQDLVTANTSGGSVSVLLGNGDGSFAESSNYVVGGTTISVAIADLDADGHAARTSPWQTRQV